MKPSAMCWTTSTAGSKSPGSAVNSWASACGPPVDAPITTTRTGSGSASMDGTVAGSAFGSCAAANLFVTTAAPFDDVENPFWRSRPRGCVMTRARLATRSRLRKSRA